MVSGGASDDEESSEEELPCTRGIPKITELITHQHVSGFWKASVEPVLKKFFSDSSITDDKVDAVLMQV